MSPEEKQQTAEQSPDDEEERVVYLQSVRDQLDPPDALVPTCGSIQCMFA